MATNRKPKPAADGLALLAVILLAPPLLLGPTWVRGLAADAWTIHYAALDRLPRPARASARVLLDKAAVAMWSLAPLPQASAAAIRVLEVAQRVQYEAKDTETALVLYRGVREACQRVRSRPLSGPGFAVIEARAAALEAGAQVGIAK